MSVFIPCIEFYSNSDILNQTFQSGPQCLDLRDTGKANNSPCWGLLFRLDTTKTHTQMHWILTTSAYRHALEGLAHMGDSASPLPQTWYIMLTLRNKYVCQCVRLSHSLLWEFCPAQSRLCSDSNPTQRLVVSEGVLGCPTTLPTSVILKCVLRDSRGSWLFWLPLAIQINEWRREEHTCSFASNTSATVSFDQHEWPIEFDFKGWTC